MYGDLRTYRISYHSFERNTANMRRAPGRQMTAVGRDVANEKSGQQVHMQIAIWNGHISYTVDGITCISFRDEDPFMGGYLGFRVMALAKGQYSHLKVHRLKDNPHVAIEP